MDIIIGAWPGFGSLNFREECLREASTIPNPPNGTVDVRDDKPLGRLPGLFEHWNNPNV